MFCLYLTVTSSATAIFCYWWLVPTAIYMLLWWRKSQAGYVLSLPYSDILSHSYFLLLVAGSHSYLYVIVVEKVPGWLHIPRDHLCVWILSGDLHSNLGKY